MAPVEVLGAPVSVIEREPESMAELVASHKKRAVQHDEERREEPETKEDSPVMKILYMSAIVAAGTLGYSLFSKLDSPNWEHHIRKAKDATKRLEAEGHKVHSRFSHEKDKLEDTLRRHASSGGRSDRSDRYEGERYYNAEYDQPQSQVVDHRDYANYDSGRYDAGCYSVDRYGADQYGADRSDAGRYDNDRYEAGGHNGDRIRDRDSEYHDRRPPHLSTAKDPYYREYDDDDAYYTRNPRPSRAYQ